MRLSISTVTLLCAGLATAAPVAESNGLLQERNHNWESRRRGDVGPRRYYGWRGSRTTTKDDSTPTGTSSIVEDVATIQTVSVPAAAAPVPPSVAPVQNAAATTDAAKAPANSNVANNANTRAASNANSQAAVATSTAVGAGSSSASTPGSIWQPKVAEPFQIVLSSVIDPKADVVPDQVVVFDIDLFATPKETITTLKGMGKKIMCYFSAGSSEDWRPDFKQFQSSDMGLGIAMDSSGSSYWPGEKWLDVRSQNVWNIMKARIQMAADKGCDAVDPDNMDGYNNNNGLGLTKEDDVKFFLFMAEEAKKLNMAIGLKNALEILPEVSSVIQFAVNEECSAFNECNRYTDFLQTKPVFHIEYVDDKQTLTKRTDAPLPHSLEPRAAAAAALAQHCTPKNAPDLGNKFSTVIKLWSLDGWVQFCDGNSATTKTS